MNRTLEHKPRNLKVLVKAKPNEKKLPPAPSHLSVHSRRFWARIVESWELEEHDLALLQAACEAWDRMQQARRQIRREGMIIPGRWGKVAHPAIAVERDCRLAFARLIKQLGLDDELPRGPGRPPQQEYTT